MSQPEPLIPRITKSTSPLVVEALFPKTSDLLKRFMLANRMASAWDGERDGIREAVKKIPAGQYDDTMISWTPTAAVCYPNADGKHQLESCLQTNILDPLREIEDVIVFADLSCATPEAFLDLILHNMQKGKEFAVELLAKSFVGYGTVVDNKTLYKKEEGTKSSIVVLPPKVEVTHD